MILMRRGTPLQTSIRRVHIDADGIGDVDVLIERDDDGWFASWLEHRHVIEWAEQREEAVAKLVESIIEYVAEANTADGSIPEDQLV